MTGALGPMRFALRRIGCSEVTPSHQIDLTRALPDRSKSSREA